MKTTIIKISKAALLMSTAGLMMGNQSCQQQAAAPKPRQLKKIVEMGRITSPAIQLPGGGFFDFQFVANQQAYGVIMDHEAFALRYNAPIVTPPSASGGYQAFNLSAGDQKAFVAMSKAAGIREYATYSKEASCMVNLPQARLSGSVNAFELIGGGGLSIGFTPTGNHTITGIGADFSFQQSQLDLTMVATRPLTDGVMAAKTVDAKQTKTTFGLSIGIGPLRLGPSGFYQTPLANVTKNALKMAVDAIQTGLDAEEWYTRVLANHDTHLVVIGGTNVNLKVGDQLIVYNEDYYWDGEPCASKYYGGGAKSPVSVIQIDWVGDEISRGQVIKQSDENAVIGAKVKVYKLSADTVVKGPPATDNLTDVAH